MRCAELRPRTEAVREGSLTPADVGPRDRGFPANAGGLRDRVALALPTKVTLARPTGVGRALATYKVPIEGRDEWLAAARRLA